MLLFSVLLLTTSALAAPPVYPAGSSVPGVEKDKVTAYKPEFVGGDAGPHLRYTHEQNVVPEHVNQPVHYRHQSIVAGSHFASQPVDIPIQSSFEDNVFFRKQPHHVVQTVHRQKPLVRAPEQVSEVHQQPQAPVHFESRKSAVVGPEVAQHQYPVGVAAKSHEVVRPVLVELKHLHIPGQDFVAGVVPKEVVTQQEAVSVDPSASARILQQNMDINPDGSYMNVWDSDNGIKVEEHGTLKHVGDADVVVNNGQISYVDNDGNTFYIRYVANENGFHVEGDHLPTPPPIPAAIARSLEFIAAHPYVESTTIPQEEYQPVKPGQQAAVVDN